MKKSRFTGSRLQGGFGIPGHLLVQMANIPAV
jgi:hypothetical protein